MPIQKNQHYVPQFYQRRFSPDKKTIGTYILEQKKKVDTAPIKHQASKDYFYTKETAVENNVEAALAKLETMGNNVMALVDANPRKPLDKKDSFTLYVFTLLQMGRTIAHAGMIQKTADVMAQQMLKEEIHLLQANGDDTVADITDDILDKIQINFANLGGFSLGLQAQLIPLCIDLKQKILINNTDMAFISSDNPTALYNMFFERIEQVEAGIGCRGVFIYMPLSPHLAIVLYDDKVYKMGKMKQSFVEIANKKDISELNKLIAVNSFQTIFYNPLLTNSSELTLLGKQSDYYTPKEKVQKVEGMTSFSGNKILGVHHIGLKCKLQLSFVKILPNYAAITPRTFDPSRDLYREIAYMKDELIDGYFNHRK